MSFSLPLTGSPIRELFDIADLAARPKLSDWPTFTQARFSARRYFAAAQGVSAINMICARADGSLHLVAFGPRDGVKVLWNFSK